MRLLLLSFVFSISSLGQQDPLMRTDGFTPFWNNPASYGARNKIGVNTIGRLQWTNLLVNSNTFMMNLDASLAIKGKVADDKHAVGVGLLYYYDGISFFDTHNFKIPLNYKVKFQHSTLSFGAGLGFMTNMLVDQAVTKFDLDAGVFFNHSKYYVGFSATQLNAPFYNELNYQGARHFYLQGGYQFDLGKVKIYPQTQFRYVGGFQGGWLMNYIQFWEEKVSLGLGLGSGSIFMGALRLNWKQWSVNYIYEINGGSLANVIGPSHELRLAFEIR